MKNIIEDKTKLHYHDIKNMIWLILLDKVQLTKSGVVNYRGNYSHDEFKRKIEEEFKDYGVTMGIGSPPHGWGSITINSHTVQNRSITINWVTPGVF